MVTFEKLGAMRRWGYLGNQMFQIACVLSMAKKHNTNAVFPHFWRDGKWGSYESFFKHGLDLSLDLNQIKKRIGERAFHYAELPFVEDMSLSGYFQSERYFEDCKDDIRRQFEFSDLVEDELDKRYSEFLEKDNTVSIHVRRGDCIGKESKHPILPMSYYKEAMSHFDGCEFIICSDDIAWCRENFEGDNISFAQPIEMNRPRKHQSDFRIDAAVDMAVMSRCKHNIIANSTFSWWSAWLNSNFDKVVITPKLWFGPAYARHNTKDLIPEGWKKI